MQIINHAVKWCHHGPGLSYWKNKKDLKNQREGKIHPDKLEDIFEVIIKTRRVLNGKYNPQTKRAKLEEKKNLLKARRKK